MLEAPPLTLQRTLDASFLNQIAAHQSVRDMLGMVEGVSLDLTATCADARNVTLLAPHGGFIYVQHEPGAYEVHTLFEPRGWGHERYIASLLSLRYVFLRTDAVKIHTKVDLNTPGAKAADFAARQAGFRKLYDAQGRFRIYSLDMEDWAQHDSETVTLGETFHQALETAKTALGSDRPAHPDDPAHNGIVGAAYQCVADGQPLKGVQFYNRWAKLAGYKPIILLSAWPPIIDVHDAIVTVTDGSMHVMQVR